MRQLPAWQLDLSAIITHEMAASMVSIDLALYAIMTNEMAASMGSIESAMYAITTSDSIDCTIIVLAKTQGCRILQLIMHQQNVSSMCAAKNLHSTLMLPSVQQYHDGLLVAHTATVNSLSVTKLQNKPNM